MRAVRAVPSNHATVSRTASPGDEDVRRLLLIDVPSARIDRRLLPRRRLGTFDRPLQPPDHETALLRWTEHGLRSLGSEPAMPLLAADSFLVEDGAVRGYDAHWQRFGGWCAELGVPHDVVGRFRTAVTARLPRSGRWFPRLEAAAVNDPRIRAGGSADGLAGAGAPQLRLRLRPARPAATEARVIVGQPSDPRTCPRWKGPDLDLLLALRAQAVAAGADELMLCDDQGRLVEGTLDSLLWWEDDVLCSTPDDATLPGVTRRLLLAIAAEHGVQTRFRSPRATELTSRETWLTNALHGIRVVTSWAVPARASGGGCEGEATPGGAGVRAAGWSAALDATALPLGAEPSPAGEP